MSIQSQVNTIRLDLPASFRHLHMLSTCVAEMLAQESNLEEREIVIYNVQLAVQEVCTNIIRHAYSPEQQEYERIHVTMRLDAEPRRLIVELFDQGGLFDEGLVQEPDLEEGQVHGYGLFIVKNLMDEVTYTRLLEGNSWSLAKNL